VHAARDAFLYVMRLRRVPVFGLAVQWWPLRSNSGKLRPFTLADRFWALTISADSKMIAGFGITRHGVCISYTKMIGPPLRSEPHPPTTPNRRPRANQMRTANGPRNFACASNPLSVEATTRVMANYLVEAVASLVDGSGPLVVNDVTPHTIADWRHHSGEQ
jgi:hypothetical protein